MKWKHLPDLEIFQRAGIFMFHITWYIIEAAFIIWIILFIIWSFMHIFGLGNVG